MQVGSKYAALHYRWRDNTLMRLADFVYKLAVDSDIAEVPPECEVVAASAAAAAAAESALVQA